MEAMGAGDGGGRRRRSEPAVEAIGAGDGGDRSRRWRRSETAVGAGDGVVKVSGDEGDRSR